MGLFRSIGARKDATRGTAAIEVRKGFANLFTGAGVLPGAASPLVAGTAGWAYSVGAAGFVSTRGASDGIHLFGNDGTVTIGTTGVGSTVPVAPGSGLERIDIAWVLHPSASENSDTISEPSFGVTSGTAASTALPPTIPTGALELARNTMTSDATSTASAGNTIAQTGLYAALRGAPIPVRNVSERDALTARDGLSVYRQDTHSTEIYQSTQWVKVTGAVEGPQASTGYSAAAVAAGASAAILGPSSITLDTAARVRFVFDLNVTSADAINAAGYINLLVDSVQTFSRRFGNGAIAAPVSANLSYEAILPAGTHTWELDLANDPGSGTTLTAGGAGNYGITW